MKTNLRMYAEIAKITEQNDGTLLVSGFASSGAVDSDGEVITPEAMKAAIPDYMKFGAVREMHQPSAAGTATRAEVNEDGKTEFEAHVVDPVAVKKVQTGVYKGFSIGGKVTLRDAADKKIIKGLNLVEVSLVDRPANPEAVIRIFKAERTPEDDVAELAELIDSGTVTPAQLIELAKAAKAAKEDEIKKGLYSVGDFACVLSSLAWITRDSQDEADYERDSSPVPKQLRDWLAEGLGILQAMAAEEAAELMQQLRSAAGDVDVLTMAAHGVDLSKAGAKFSAGTKDTLAAVHKAMQDAHAGLKDACDKMDALEYKDDGNDDAAMAAQVEGLQKAADVARAEVAEALQKAQTLQQENEVLAKRVKELEAMPAAVKGVAKAIDKTADSTTGASAQLNGFTPVVDNRGQLDEAATLIKAIHTGAIGRRLTVTG